MTESRARRRRAQSFKVSNVKEGPKGSKGEQYTLADFEYEIFTGGNASVRKGKASITSLNGKTVECLVGITTIARYGSGGIGDKLAESVKSFRVCVTSPVGAGLVLLRRGGGTDEGEHCPRDSRTGTAACRPISSMKPRKSSERRARGRTRACTTKSTGRDFGSRAAQ